MTEFNACKKCTTVETNSFKSSSLFTKRFTQCLYCRMRLVLKGVWQNGYRFKNSEPQVQILMMPFTFHFYSNAFRKSSNTSLFPWVPRVSKLDEQTCKSEFEAHWVPYSFRFVPHISFVNYYITFPVCYGCVVMETDFFNLWINFCSATRLGEKNEFKSVVVAFKN